MPWGIVMAFPTVLGMLLLIFAQPGGAEYQTFGREVVNRPEPANEDERIAERRVRDNLCGWDFGPAR